MGAGSGRAERGRCAEALAAACLERAGMRVVTRNWRRPEGELDLIAVDTDGTFVFCEVRSRTGERTGGPLDAVNARKQARVIRMARTYLSEEAVTAPAFRFDVVAVTFTADCPPRLVHLRSAFETRT